MLQVSWIGIGDVTGNLNNPEDCAFRSNNRQFKKNVFSYHTLRLRDSSPVIMVFVKSGYSMSWVYGYDLKTKSLHHFSYNENPMKAQNTSLECCLPSTDVIDRQEKFMHAYEDFRSSHASALHWSPPGFCKENFEYFSNRVIRGSVNK